MEATAPPRGKHLFLAGVEKHLTLVYKAQIHIHTHTELQYIMWCLNFMEAAITGEGCLKTLVGGSNSEKKKGQETVA